MTNDISDLHAWLQSQAASLRSGNFAALDAGRLADAVEKLARSEQNQLKLLFSQLQLNLVGLQYSTSITAPGQVYLLDKIRICRTEIADKYSASPSLRRYGAELFSAAWELSIPAATLVVRELPAVCPFTLEQALNSDYPPGANVFQS